MTYPKFRNKHKEKPFFHPGKFDEKKKPKDFPKKFLFIYYDVLLNYFKRNYKYKRYRINELVTIYKHKDIGVVRVPGIGSPVAVWIMERLIANGGKKFISIGTAGGLKERGIFLCNKALRDEGTSYHYIPTGHYIYSDEKLTKKLSRSIKNSGLDYNIGPTWTIDALYRETVSEVEKYSKKGIATIDMEASALFSVGKFRKVKVASAFVVSDTLINREHIRFTKKKHFRDLIKKLFDAGIDCLK